MKEKSLEQAYAEEAAIKKALTEKYRADAAKDTARLKAAAVEHEALEAKCFRGECVHREADGSVVVLDPNGYEVACFNTPESIETLYTELKKALNK